MKTPREFPKAPGYRATNETSEVVETTVLLLNWSILPIFTPEYVVVEAVTYFPGSEITVEPDVNVDEDVEPTTRVAVITVPSCEKLIDEVDPVLLRVILVIIIYPGEEPVAATVLVVVLLFVPMVTIAEAVTAPSTIVLVPLLVKVLVLVPEYEPLTVTVTLVLTT